MRRLTRGKTWLLKVASNITKLQYYNFTSHAPLMQGPTKQLQSPQQPKSTCSQLKNAFVGFQQTPKRQGQQTKGRLLPACSAFTKPPSSLSNCQQLNIYQSRGNNRYAIYAVPSRYGWAHRLAAFAPRPPNSRRIPADSKTARTTNDGTFASSLLSVHQPPELTTQIKYSAPITIGD